MHMQLQTTGWQRLIGQTALALTVIVWLGLATPALGQQDPATGQPAQPVPANTDTQDADQETPGTGEQPSTEGNIGAQTEDPDRDPQRGAAEPEAKADQPGDQQLAGTEAQPVTSPPRAPKEPSSYGLWVLLPAIVAILLAILARQVIPALVVGVLVGAYMMVPCLAPGDAFADSPSVVAGVRLAAEQYILGAVTDPKDNYGHISIIVFTLVIGFMVGVIGRNGGTEGMVRLVAGKTSSRRRVGLTAWLAGLVVFFDDYSNTMIVGPTMRSVFDRVKLSRAKLAYIVDSTAAPVASIALIGTWVGTEISLIQGGLDAVTDSGAPAFLLNEQGEVIKGMQAFVASIAYRFYPILALFFVFLVTLTGFDFGPMKRCERKVLSKIDPDPRPKDEETAEASKPTARWWLAFCPILALIVATVFVLASTGYYATAPGEVTEQMPWWQKAATVAGNGDTFLSIYYGALLSALVAIILTLLVRACSLCDAIDAGLEGMAKMFPAMVILVLAWALSTVLQDLKLGVVVAGHMQALDFPPIWLPLAIFLSAAVISFATGTSWGTMGILCPLTVEISARLMGDLPSAEALTLFYASVGSVLAGAVFGDHCSPISDTTVLSSIASGCPHEEHVWTQIPYALAAAIAAMLMGDVMCSVYHQPWYLGLGAGAIFLVLVLFTFGRRAQPSLELADV